MKTAKLRIINKYEEDIVILITANKVIILYFKSTGQKILTDVWSVWYQKRCSFAQKNDSVLRIVQTVTMIVAEDIWSQVYKSTQYPPADEFLKVNESHLRNHKEFLKKTLLNK